MHLLLVTVRPVRGLALRSCLLTDGNDSLPSTVDVSVASFLDSVLDSSGNLAGSRLPGACKPFSVNVSLAQKKSDAPSPIAGISVPLFSSMEEAILPM